MCASILVARWVAVSGLGFRVQHLGFQIWVLGVEGLSFTQKNLHTPGKGFCASRVICLFWSGVRLLWIGRSSNYGVWLRHKRKTYTLREIRKWPRLGETYRLLTMPLSNSQSNCEVA